MVISFPILPFVFLLFRLSEAGGREILVGGSATSWKVPESSNNTLNHWAEKTRFKVGDVLVWKYDEKRDSVLRVSKEDYESCNTSKPIKEHKDSLTKIQLDKSGPFYFISGAPGSCGKGQKLVVVVLSPNHHTRRPGCDSKAPAPAPSKNAAVGSLAGRGSWGLSLVAGLVVSLA